MFRNNPLLAQLKDQIRAATPRVEGVIKATDKNFGFLESDDGKSYFVPPPAMKQVLHGDRVVAVLKEDGDKTSAEPETLVAAGLNRFIARVRKRDGRLGVLPDHTAIRLTIKARVKNNLDEASLADGDWVVAHLVRHPLKEGDNSFLCQIDELLIKNDDPAAPWRITLARHELEQECPDHGSDWPLRDEGLSRDDLTDQPFFTIDSEYTQDMDDALRVTRNANGGWQLTVAVADPTAYLDEEHAADIEARTRAFTVYLPGRNITMLPERLAHDLCSLVEGEPRPVLACTLTINSDGSLGEYRFCAATIQSRAKLAYDRVSDWLESQGEWTPDPEIADQLTALAELTAARISWRAEHAQMFQDRPDYVFDLDDAGNVLAVRAEERRLANRMIEEAMIAANICGSELLANQVGHGIFNVHHAFGSEKVAAAHQFLNAQDVEVEPEVLTELTRYPILLRILAERRDAWLHARLRQFQGFTVIAAQPGPHFGMGLPAYATWTSPIRKYGDMANHRLIKLLLKGESSPTEASEQLIEQLSERRRLNRLAERDVKDWLYVRFLSDGIKAGGTFEAEVIAINRGGMRVRLIANGATAFVPASLIHDNKEELVIDDKEGRIQVKGETHFQLGDLISVILTEAREESRTLVARPAGKRQADEQQ